MLTHDAFEKAALFMRNQARSLDYALFNYSFNSGTTEDVIDALAAYRNPDGGFGHGLEPDVQAKASNNYATTVAFQYLNAAQAPSDHEFYVDGVQYFVNTYDPQHKGWELVGALANDAPHAPWWDHNGSEDTARDLDQHWANCSAEILGYLYKYSDQVPPNLLLEAEEVARNDLKRIADKLGMHEFLCYQQLAKSAPDELSQLVLEKLKACISSTVALSEDKWTGYDLRPWWVVESPQNPLATHLKNELLQNLEFEIHQQGADGAWHPFWSWGRDEEHWKKAEQEWKGYLTVRFLRVLKNFNLIEIT